MPLRKRPGSPFWWYDFQVGGRRVRGSTKTADRRDAEIIAGKIRSDLLLGTYTGRKPRLTLDDAFGRYESEHAARLPSVESIEYALAALLAGLGKTVTLDALSNSGIADYMARRRATVSDSTVNRELSYLRAIMNMARDRWGVAVAEIKWRRHRLPEPDHRDRYFTPAQIDKLLAEAAAHLKPAIEFSLFTGVRLANCIGLDWSQIDLRARIITFRVKAARSPGGKVHELPITEPVLVLLANLGPRGQGRVFLYKGRPIKTWRTAWRAALRRAGLEGFRWHDLRHTAASWMVQRGVPLDVVRDVLGHANIATTMRYAHRETTAKRAALEALASHARHSEPISESQDIEAKGKTA